MVFPMVDMPPFRRRLPIGTLSPRNGVLPTEEFARWLDDLRTNISASGASSAAEIAFGTLYLSSPVFIAATEYTTLGDPVSNTEYNQSQSIVSNTIY